MRLVTLLQSGRSYNADELADELSVSRRTVFRDLNMLEMAHIPYYYDHSTGGYKINRHFFLPPVNLSLTEALAVLMVTRDSPRSRGVPLLSDSARAALKLEGVLPPNLRRYIGSVIERSRVILGPVSSHEGTGETFEDLVRAIVEHNVCEIVYLSFANRKQIKILIHPLRVVFVERAWYVLAYTPRHGEIRTYKLIRIRKFHRRKEIFTPPPDEQVDGHFGRAWCMIPEGTMYDVHLRFEPRVAGNVAEVQWHDSQQVQWNDDGSMEFRVTVDGLGEITWWVLGYGDQVAVVSPPELRAKIARAARAVLEKYPDPEP